MRIGSLFSGIGGLELGLEWAGLGPVVWQVEMDPWCRSVLARHWPDADRSVTDVRAATASDLAQVDLICGGFPCQDVSSAGKGAGLEGARSGLWYEYARIIGELRPRFVVVENVASGAKRWLDVVCDALDAMGYRVRPFGLSAADVGAPHRRRRVFVVADAISDELRLEQGGVSRSDRPRPSEPGDAREARPEPLAHGHGHGREGERRSGLLDGVGAARGNNAYGCGGADVGLIACGCGRIRDASITYLGDAHDHQSHERQGKESTSDFGAIPRRIEFWPGGSSGAAAPPERGMGRSAYGLPARVERFPAGRGEAQFDWEPPRTSTEKGGNRRARLRGLGNAVMPQCAEVIGRIVVQEMSR